MEDTEIKVTCINLTEGNKKYVTELLVDLLQMVKDFKVDLNDRQISMYINTL